MDDRLRSKSANFVVSISNLFFPKQPRHRRAREMRILLWVLLAGALLSVLLAGALWYMNRFPRQ